MKLFGAVEVPQEGGVEGGVEGGPAEASGPLAGTYVFVGADAYKSLGERITNINGGTGALTGSFGGVVGANSGFALGDTDLGVQAGASYGIYDFKGRIALVPNATDTERQTYYTVGLYKHGNMAAADPTIADRISLGVVYDGFRAERWGVNANSIDLGQVRASLGYALSRSTEIGAWGAFGVRGDRAAVTVAGAPNLLTDIRPASHANLYLKHNFDFGGQIMGYVGMFDGADIGQWQAGIAGKMPLSSHWSTYASANYVSPRTPAGPLGSGQEQFSASFGLAYYFGGNAASSTVTGDRHLPLLDVASSRTFLVTD